MIFLHNLYKYVRKKLCIFLYESKGTWSYSKGRHLLHQKYGPGSRGVYSFTYLKGGIGFKGMALNFGQGAPDRKLLMVTQHPPIATCLHKQSVCTCLAAECECLWLSAFYNLLPVSIVFALPSFKIVDASRVHKEYPIQIVSNKTTHTLPLILSCGNPRNCMGL